MIVIYELANNIIKVSEEYIKEALALYLDNILLKVKVNSITFTKNLHKKSSDYSVTLMLDYNKEDFDYEKAETLMKNVKSYLYKNFNLSCILSIGI